MVLVLLFLVIAPHRLHAHSQLVSDGDFSEELLKTKSKLLENLDKELVWKNKLKKQIESEKVLNNVLANQVVQDLCDRLASLYGVPDELWPKCKVAATFSPNAWAYPTGDIFVTAGLLGILDRADSLALILGHEIGHVVARHATRKSSWAFLPKVARKAISRKYEEQADRIGQEIAYAAGAYPHFMKMGWAFFMAYNTLYFPQETSLKQKLMQDHPDNVERLNGFISRFGDIELRLINLNLPNLLNDEFSGFKKVHQTLRPYALAFGKTLREKSQKQATLQETLSGRQSLCMGHVLPNTTEDER